MEISMSQKLQVKAFFFNAKTDYLPYYKQFTLVLADDACAKDILVAISEQNWDFSYPEHNLVFKINNLVVVEDTPVSEIVERLGNTLQIDSLNSYRATNGLIINDDDFMKSFELLAPFANDTDKAYYKTLYALHYASETENFDREYIGDAVLIMAHKMIKDGNVNKKEILTAITSAHSGLLDCEYENNLFYAQEHTENINELKSMLSNDDNNHPTLLDLIMKSLGREKVEPVTQEIVREKKTIENLSEKQIAYYAGTSRGNTNVVSQVILDMGAKEISFSRTNKLSGLTVLENNKTLAFKKAGAILLDAFDSSAEVLVVENLDAYDMFIKHYAQIEKTLGREIIGLDLISAEDFISQISKPGA